MFINCKKNLAIRIDGEVKSIPAGYIGSISDDLAKHWMIRAAIKDGTIATPDGASDKKLEQADEMAAEKAEAADIRPEDQAAEKSEATDKKLTAKK